MTKLMEALVVVGGLAALAYFMSKPKARPTAADFMADQQNSVAFYKRKEAEGRVFNVRRVPSSRRSYLPHLLERASRH
jgi:hypothetical protein